MLLYTRPWQHLLAIVLVIRMCIQCFIMFEYTVGVKPHFYCQRIVLYSGNIFCLKKGYLPLSWYELYVLSYVFKAVIVFLKECIFRLLVLKVVWSFIIISVLSLWKRYFSTTSKTMYACECFIHRFLISYTKLYTRIFFIPSLPHKVLKCIIRLGKSFTHLSIITSSLQ